MNDRIDTQTHALAFRRQDWGHWLLHRWPTVLGIAIAFLTAFDLQLDRATFTALVYLGAAVIGRHTAAWLLFVVGFVAIFVLRLLNLSSALLFAFLVIAVGFLLFSLVRGRAGNRGSLSLQTIGMLGFGALALSVLYVDLTWAGYLIVAALLTHAIWDAFHLWRNRVVATSYAEFCGVLDLVLGVAILITL